MASRKKRLSREEIHALRGKYKLNIGGKSFAEWMADLNREEKESEERKFQRLAALGKKSVVQEHLVERRAERDRENRWAAKSKIAPET